MLLALPLSTRCRAYVADTATAGTLLLRRLLHRCSRSTTFCALSCLRFLFQRAALLLLTSPLLARRRCAASYAIAAATTISVQ